MSQNSPLEGGRGRARSPANAHLIQKPRYALSYVVGPPLSPPPTSPLPPPPISPSPISSLCSDTSLLRLPRTNTTLSTLRSASAGPFDCVESSSRSAETTIIKSVQLQSPFTSPSKAVSFSDAQIVPFSSIPSPGSAVLAKPLSRNETSTTSENRIWWSPTTSGAVVPIFQTLTERPPPVPPRSKKRRSKRPPRKAVARSALYIPSPSRSEENFEINTASSPDDVQVNWPLQEELVTSLPPLHNSMRWTSEIHNEKGTRQKRDKKATEPCLISAVPSNSPNVPSHSDTSDRRVAFRAVTNLQNPRVSREVNGCVEKTTHETDESRSTPRVPIVQGSKFIWICVTVVFVLSAVGGILTGVIWKLTRI